PIAAHLPRGRQIPRPTIHQHPANDDHAEERVHRIREEPHLQHNGHNQQTHRCNEPSHRDHLGSKQKTINHRDTEKNSKSFICTSAQTNADKSHCTKLSFICVNLRSSAEKVFLLFRFLRALSVSVVNLSSINRPPPPYLAASAPASHP